MTGTLNVTRAFNADQSVLGDKMKVSNLDQLFVCTWTIIMAEASTSPLFRIL
jgi:hypothetical protein